MEKEQTRTVAVCDHSSSSECQKDCSTCKHGNDAYFVTLGPYEVLEVD